VIQQVSVFPRRITGRRARSALLRLTEEGHRLVREADAIAATMEGALLGRLTHGGGAILFELLDKISSPRPPHAQAAHPE
jgi:DNA-binding MarR family transcriptional regulator